MNVRVFVDAKGRCNFPAWLLAAARYAAKLRGQMQRSHGHGIHPHKESPTVPRPPARARCLRIAVALSLASSLLVGPANTAAANGLIGIPEGTQVTAQDIAQFDALWWGLLQSNVEKREVIFKNQRDIGIGLDIAYDAMAIVRMFELTRDRKYLDHLRKMSDQALTYRDDRHPGDVFDEAMNQFNPDCLNCTKPFVDGMRGNVHIVHPAWGSGVIKHYVGNGGLTPVSAPDSGLFIYPMAAFARIVAEDPSLHMVYGTDAMAYANAAMETMWVFMPDFKEYRVGSYVEGSMYRLKTVATDKECDAAYKTAKNYLTLHSGKTGNDLKPLISDIDKALKSCKENHLFADQPYAHNESMSLVMSFIELWRALDSSFYQTHVARASDAGLARALIPLVAARQQRYFVNRLKLENDDDEGVRYLWNYNDYNVDGPTKRLHDEDTGHGNLDMSYLYVLRDGFDRLNAIVAPLGEPIPLDDAILRRFANTFLQKVARPDKIDQGGDLACNVDGQTARECDKDPWAYNTLCNGWGNLASVDATVYRVCHLVSLRTSERGRDHRALQYDLTPWNHSTLLATKRFSRTVTDLDLTNESVSPSAAGNPFGWVHAAQDEQNVVFRGTDGHVYDLWRTAGGIGYTNLSGPAGAPRAKGDPKGYEFPALATHNVVYRGTDDHLHLLYWRTGAVTHVDLTVRSGAPKPAGDPFPYVRPLGELSPGVQNVVYRGTDGHLHLLYWTFVDDGGILHHDLTARSGAPKPDGDPFGYFINSQGLNHVVYRAKDRHLHGTYWTTGQIFDDDLTSASGAPAPAGDPTAYETPAGLQNVVYRGTDGRLHGLYWTAGEVGHDDLSNAVSGAPLPADDPTAYFNAQDGTHHMIYRTSNGHLHELAFTTGAVTHTDLSTVVPAPSSEGKEVSAYVFAAQRSQHVIFRAKNGQLHDLTWRTPIVDGPPILTQSLRLFDAKR